MPGGNEGRTPGDRSLPGAARFGLYLAFFTLVFFRFWDQALTFRDSFVFFAPNKFLIATALRHGRLDLWNPWILLGVPLAGEVQAGLFYPLNLLFAVLSFGAAHRLFILLHYPLAAFFMDTYLRGRGHDRRVAVFGGLAYALSGYMISQHGLVRMALGGAWLPLVLYCFDRAARERFYAAAAGAALAMMVLASDPETALLTAAIGAAMLAGRAAAERRPAPLVNLALAGVTAFALSAIAVLPAREMIAATSRAAGVPLDKATIFSFHPAELIEFLWPTPFGVNWPDYNYWGQFIIGLDPGKVNVPWSDTNYLGMAVLALAAVGLTAGARKTWPLLLGVVIFLLLALGRHTPVYGWVHAVAPVFGSIRYPSKFVIFVTFYLVAAAAAGLDTLLGWQAAGDRRAQRAALIYLAATVVIAGLMLWLWPMVMAGKTLFRPHSPLYHAGVEHFYAGWKQWVAVNLLLGAAGLATARGWLRPRLGLPLCLAIIIADWWLSCVAIMPVTPAAVYSFTPLAETVIARAEPPAPGQYRIFQGRMSFGDKNPILPDLSPATRKDIWLRNVLFPNLSILSRIESMRGYDSYDFSDDHGLLDRDAERWVMEMFNVRFVLDQGSGPVQRGEVIYDDPQNELRVTRLLDYWPRAYFASRPLPARDPAEARALLPRAWTERTAVIIGAEAQTTSATTTAAAGAGMVPAKIQSYEPDRVRIGVDAPAAGWLVLSDRFFPGWVARVDGQQTEIHRANVLGRAVRVGAGRHEVEFRYQPRSVLAGELISIPAWIAFLGIWVARRRRERNKA